MSDDVLAWLADWFVARGAIALPLADDFASANFFERCWVDSFAVVELIEDSERRFGIRFIQEELDDASFGKVSRFAELVQHAMKRAGRSG